MISPSSHQRRPAPTLARLLAITALLTLVFCAPAIARGDVATSPRAAGPRPSTRAPGSALAPSSERRSARSADASTITFDEVGLGDTVTDQYQAEGVIFDSDVFTTDDGSADDSPVLSGEPEFEGDIRGHFVDPASGAPRTVTSFTLDVGYIDNRDSTDVEAYDSSGNLLETVVAEENGYNTLTVTDAQVASFVVRSITDEPAGFAIDNLQIDQPGEPQVITSVASLGDSYASGEGLLGGAVLNDDGTPFSADPSRYDCGTDLNGQNYYENTSAIYAAGIPPVWGRFDCDTANDFSNLEPDLSARFPTRYDNRCHRAATAYPRLIATQLHAAHELFVACSGATTANVGEILGTSKPQHSASPLNVAGGDVQSDDLANWSRDRLGGQAPSLITIGIGGNDADFAGIAARCVITVCSANSGFRNAVHDKIAGPVHDNITATLTGLRYDYPASTIVAFSYPSPVSGKTTMCNAGVPDVDASAYLAGTVLKELNQTIADAADEAGVSYVDVSGVTQGHELCTAHPWFRGLSYPVQQSFHPTQQAHQAIAAFFKNHYEDAQGHLLIQNPSHAGNPLSVEPSGDASVIAQVTASPTEPCATQCASQTPCLNGCSINLQGGGYTPGSQLQVVLHSDPRDLGTLTADDDGNIDTTVQIPADVPGGEHVITIDGTSPDGVDQFGTIGVDIGPDPDPTLNEPNLDNGGPVPAPLASAPTPVVVGHAAISLIDATGNVVKARLDSTRSFTVRRLRTGKAVKVATGAHTLRLRIGRNRQTVKVPALQDGDLAAVLIIPTPQAMGAQVVRIPRGSRRVLSLLPGVIRAPAGASRPAKLKYGRFAKLPGKSAQRLSVERKRVRVAADAQLTVFARPHGRRIHVTTRRAPRSTA